MDHHEIHQIHGKWEQKWALDDFRFQVSSPNLAGLSALCLFPVLPAFDFIVISSNAGKSGPLIIHVLIVN
jgi:hypothetical protein